MNREFRDWLRQRSGSGPLCLVSACLCGIACRYDAKASFQEPLAMLREAGLALAVCPEADAGLPVPRPPCEIQGARVFTREGEDKTQAFHKGAQLALALARKHGITLAILKDKSPSCGSGVIYDGSFSRTLIPGRGIAAALLMEHGIRVVSEDTYPPVLLSL